MELEQYSVKQLDDFCEYMFGIRYWMVKQMQKRERGLEKEGCN